MTLYNIFCDHVKEGIGKLILGNIHLLDTILYVIETRDESDVLIEVLHLLNVVLEAGRYIAETDEDEGEIVLNNPITEYMLARPQIKYLEDLQRSSNSNVKDKATEIINLYFT